MPCRVAPPHLALLTPNGVLQWVRTIQGKQPGVIRELCATAARQHGAGNRERRSSRICRDERSSWAETPAVNGPDTYLASLQRLLEPRSVLLLCRRRPSPPTVTIYFELPLPIPRPPTRTNAQSPGNSTGPPKLGRPRRQSLHRKGSRHSCLPPPVNPEHSVLSSHLRIDKFDIKYVSTE